MKKALSLILALVMVLGLSVTALADDNTKNATVTATVPGMTYEMVVPSAADLTETSHSEVKLGGDTGTVTVSNVSHADASKKIVYTVTFGNEMFLKNGDKSMAVSYKVDGNTLTTDSEVTVFDGSDTVDSVVTATVADPVWAAAAEGTYTEILTFHFAVKEVDTSITYMDWDGTKLVEKPVPDDAIEVTNETTALEAGKFYVVNGEVSTSTLTVNGTTDNPTTLILMDGAKLTVTGTIGNAGIKVTSDNALVITGQKLGTGELTATGGGGIGGDIGGAGIGGGPGSAGGNVTINGGTVTATGGGKEGSAGIGGSAGGGGGNVTINGGTVTATGKGGAGIGGGEDSSSHGAVTFGEGVDFTVYAGNAAPGSETTTTDYAATHSAKYVKIEETPGSV